MFEQPCLPDKQGSLLILKQTCTKGLQTAKNLHQTVEHLFRHESGKMNAVLSRLLGLQNMETAQDIAQDTLLQAMNTWSYNGIPENPQAWLYRVAKNKAIDFLRRQKKI